MFYPVEATQGRCIFSPDVIVHRDGVCSLL